MTIQGIEGINIGDGSGGHTALSVIDNKVLRILADSNLTFRTATIMNAESVKAGTVWFNVPEIIGTGAYGTGTGASATIQNGGVSVNINIRDWTKYEYETFDVSRMGSAESILTQIATSVAMSIENRMEATFLDFLCTQFNVGGSLASANQKISLAELSKKHTTFNQALADTLFGEYMSVENAINEISTLYDKRHLGVPKDEIISIVAPLVDVNLRYAFRNQPNQIGEWQITPTLVGKRIGNWKYQTSTQLLQNIPANSSFSNDKAYDFTNYAGFILHNESVAMPFNYNSTVLVQNPQNGNPIFITKYQYGIGLLRPKLIWALVNSEVRSK